MVVTVLNTMNTGKSIQATVQSIFNTKIEKVGLKLSSGLGILSIVLLIKMFGFMYLMMWQQIQLLMDKIKSK